jgi:hypothetical protein
MQAAKTNPAALARLISDFRIPPPNPPRTGLINDFCHRAGI